jgi:hypothetical protein
MKHGVTSFSSAILLSLLAAPLAAWADAYPDFDDDAKPILHTQPGLLRYVESHFDVADTGKAKYPGDDDRRPIPPYIFRARPIGSDGPFNLRLLIQPGQPGHILGVVDITKIHARPPGAPAEQGQIANQPPAYQGQGTVNEPRVGQAFTPPSASSPAPSYQMPPTGQTEPPAQAPAPAPSAPAASPSGPTADTPSGPILGPDDSSASPQQNLAPPPDPAPNTR